ncbi:MAG: dienelactone hydrolase family protein [Rhodocyclaceae bacterium]|nr:dienelactone hydrolase family protein [Rhodocyclaceae bacterium]
MTDHAIDRRSPAPAGRPTDGKFAAAAAPAPAATTICTGCAGLDCGELRIATDDGAMPAYYARPDTGGRLPTILVVQEIFGVHEHIRDICRRLAQLGYLAVAPKLYFRHGDPARHTEIARIVGEIVARVPVAGVMADLDATAAWARSLGGDPDRLGITGFCWGGRMCWLYAAHNPRLKAAVAWYGRLREGFGDGDPRSPLSLAASLLAPVLGLYGGQDNSIPVADVEAMREALTAAGQTSEIVVYRDAGHAFYADYRPSYRAAEAADGWRRMRRWFVAHGV